MRENIADFSVIGLALIVLLAILVSGVTLEALLTNIVFAVVALITVAFLVKNPKAVSLFVSKLVPAKPMHILTPPAEPMHILMPPVEPMHLTPPELEKDDVLGVLAHQEAVLLWGQKGSGKTTLLLAIANKRRQLGHQIYVCDPHACPSKWGQAKVVGGGRNYGQIEQFLLQIEDLMDKRYKEIYKGDAKEGEHAHISIIIDEYRSIVTKTDECSGVIKTLLTEARKASIWLVVVSHSPTATSLGFKGEAVLKEGLAIAHLQKQRNGKRLVNVRLNGDKPFSLPLPNYGGGSGSEAEAGGSGSEASEASEAGGSGSEASEAGGSGSEASEAGGSGSEASEAGGSGSEAGKSEAILKMFLSGMSQKQIASDLFGVQGGRRYKEVSEKINDTLRGALEWQTKIT